MIRITGSFTQILRNWMRHRGIESRELRTRLDLLATRRTVAAAEWRALLEEATRLAPEEAIGIQIGAEVEVKHAGVLGFLVLNSENLAEALETYLHGERHFYGVNFAALKRRKSGWDLSWPQLVRKDNALFEQVAVSALVTFLRQRFPGSCDLLSVAFTADPPANAAPFEQFFACPVRFGSACAEITFNAAGLHKPVLEMLPHDFHTMRQQQLEAFANVIEIADSFLLRLRHVLLRLLPEGKATLPRVARQLNCSPRTVQRKLSGYHLSHQALLDGVREQLARRYLLQTSLALAEIPLLLGFADQSAFSRAFKSWTGVTPGKYRRKARI